MMKAKIEVSDLITLEPGEYQVEIESIPGKSDYGILTIESLPINE